jgi:hypothetical protein
MTGKDRDPSYFRARAERYREFATQESDPDRAALFIELARAFELEAEAIEKDNN